MSTEISCEEFVELCNAVHDAVAETNARIEAATAWDCAAACLCFVGYLVMKLSDNVEERQAMTKQAVDYLTETLEAIEEGRSPYSGTRH